MPECCKRLAATRTSLIALSLKLSCFTKMYFLQNKGYYKDV